MHLYFSWNTTFCNTTFTYTSICGWDLSRFVVWYKRISNNFKFTFSMASLSHDQCTPVAFQPAYTMFIYNSDSLSEDDCCWWVEMLVFKQMCIVQFLKMCEHHLVMFDMHLYIFRRPYFGILLHLIFLSIWWQLIITVKSF